MSEAELGEHGAGGREAEALGEVFPQQAHRHRVQQQRALSCEPDDTSLRVQLQELFVIQILGAHPHHLFELKDGTSS